MKSNHVVNEDENGEDKVPVTEAGQSNSFNQDELTLKQQEAIENEISTNIPLVGPVESLANLKSEYLNDGVYITKIEDLLTKYSSLRRIRPDGNCFYRAFSFGLLEKLVQNQDPTQIQKFIEKLSDTKSMLGNVGFNQFTIDDFYDTFMETLEKLKNNEINTVKDLEQQFQEQSVADYLVVYLRILTSAELRASSDFYSNFVEKPIEEFCQLEVEPMYKESDHIHIIGLTKVLNIGVRIVYMDRGTGAQHDFPDDLPPTIILLYRPGHYDILYEQPSQ